MGGGGGAHLLLHLSWHILAVLPLLLARDVCANLELERNVYLREEKN